MKTKLEVIQGESGEGDAQKREEDEGGLLLTSTPEVLNIDEETKMDCHRKMDGSSDWRERW